MRVPQKEGSRKSKTAYNTAAFERSSVMQKYMGNILVEVKYLAVLSQSRFFFYSTLRKMVELKKAGSFSGCTVHYL